MARVIVRYWRGSWVVDVSTEVAGRRKRTITAFGAGSNAKAAAEAYREEIAQQVKSEKFWERRTATFRDLWQKFAAHELLGPVPGPSTIADYKMLARLYLLPHLGDRLLTDIDAEVLTGFKATLLTSPGAKAAGKEGSGRPLSARSVAKILTLAGTVFRFGKRIKLVSDNPAADVRKPRVAKKPVYILEPDEIARLRTALDIPWERLLVELTMMTGLRSGEGSGTSVGLD